MVIGPRDSEVGNPEAASDLYGLGVRVGIYLQAFGTYFYILRSQAGGTKLTSSGLMIAMLASWSILVSRDSISPAEALAIHTIASVPGAPAVMASFASNATVGEGTGILAIAIAVAWRDVAMLAFWAKLYRLLPSLGTPNKTWFFVQVDIDGWFRIFSLVMTVTSVLNLFTFLPVLWKVMKLCINSYWHGSRPEEDDEPLSDLRRLIWIVLCVMIPGLLAITIALVEMTIKYNHLTPAVDMTKAGQAIPLAVGIITFLDGFLVLVRPKRSSSRNAI
ncbi:uncharacterized protein J7T54_006354 [Emericellopsis cladophorae]|uniref:Uncharacterized protein n=1 Tax=Emericellopsis cladophorae TaxID=2686198 RepID=A0A9P9YA97_9HYPO|nr:uncharacterized protein J7T54_006354 [Emericellopsis cladophorae]KAI6786015.1 hypothetical protein J7T54_006354 [Emericellopsis cladophorae]